MVGATFLAPCTMQTDTQLVEVRVTAFVDGSDQHRQPSTELVYLARCDLGWGVFAATDIAVGAQILMLTGPIISTAQAIAKGERQGDPLQIGHDRYIDLDLPGVFLNHSCEPNTAITDDRLLVALRHIHRHDELRFDYSTTMSGDGWTMACRCGVKGCRRTIGNFEFLPHDLQRQYIERKIVQPFIRKRHVQFA